MKGGSMLRPHKRVSGGVKAYQKTKSSFFVRFYVMPPLTNGGITKMRYLSITIIVIGFIICSLFISFLSNKVSDYNELTFIKIWDRQDPQEIDHFITEHPELDWQEIADRRCLFSKFWCDQDHNENGDDHRIFQILLSHQLKWPYYFFPGSCVQMNRIALKNGWDPNQFFSIENSLSSRIGRECGIMPSKRRELSCQRELEAARNELLATLIKKSKIHLDTVEFYLTDELMMDHSNNDESWAEDIVVKYHIIFHPVIFYLSDLLIASPQFDKDFLEEYYNLVGKYPPPSNHELYDRFFKYYDLLCEYQCVQRGRIMSRKYIVSALKFGANVNFGSYATEELWRTFCKEDFPNESQQREENRFARYLITPLMMAASYGELDLIKLFLDYGADPSIITDGYTALDFCRRSNWYISPQEKQQAIELLEKKIEK